MLGSHLSIAGSMVNALNEAHRLGMDCVQVFTKNQRQWKAKPLDPDEVRVWRDRLRELGWSEQPQSRLVSHNSYLINLASPDPELRDKSIALQREELERCEALGIPFCVAHPGAHLGEPPAKGSRLALDGTFTASERSGLDRIVSALDEIHNALRGYKVLTLLETTVGAGTSLGYDFAHLANVREHVKEPNRIGFCLDSCHVHAAGYDLSTAAATAAMLEQFNERCGLEHLRAMHLNDSVGARGSRKDRHAHIGHGTIGLDAFRTIVNDTRLRSIPMILETEKADHESGEPWDAINLRVLRDLIADAEPATSKKRKTQALKSTRTGSSRRG